MNARQAATFLRALGDPTRLRIIAALSGGAKSVAALVRLLDCPVFRLSRHLRYLQARAVVETWSARGAVMYGLAAPRHALHVRVLGAAQECLAAIEEVKEDRRRAARRGGAAVEGAERAGGL